MSSKRWITIGALIASTLATGCLVTSVKSFPRAQGRVAKASCMCAECWERPFCYHAATDTTIALSSLADPCPDGTEKSVVATRILFSDVRSDPFYCVLPAPGKNLNPTGVSQCPANDGDRAELEWVDPCHDVLLCARHGAAFADCDELPEEWDDCRATVHSGPNRSVCGGGATEALEKMALSCARWGLGVPGGSESRRFCFAACGGLVPIITMPGGTEGDIGNDCPVEHFDPPQVTHGAVEVDVTGQAIIGVSTPAGSQSGVVDVAGEFAIDMPGCGLGVLHCEASLTYLRIDSLGTLSLAGETVSRLRLINIDPLPDDVDSVDGVHADFFFLPGGQFFLSGDVVGVDDGRPSIMLSNSDAISGTINWVTREIMMEAVLENEDGSATVTVTVRGSLNSLPPTAGVNPPQTVECASPDGTPAMLSAATSTDPDGADDIAWTMWSANIDGVDRQVGSDTEVEVLAPLGETRYRASVSDRAGHVDVAGTTVEVVDTTGPEFSELELTQDCLWPPSHNLHLFRLGDEITADAVDQCDASARTVRIVNVLSNESVDGTGDGSTAPDIRFGTGAVCLRGERDGGARGRVYTIVLEAEDASGNVTEDRVEVRVPHDQRRPDRCTSVEVPSVADDDPRCEAAAPELASAGADAAVATTSSAAGCSASGRFGGAVPPVSWLFFVAIIAAARWKRRWRR